MGKNLALGVVIGGTVAPTVGKAFADVEGRVKHLGEQAKKVRALQGMIGETIRLREEWRQAHLSGSAAADGLRHKLETNLEALRRHGLAVRNLSKEYKDLGRVGRGLELQAKGREQIQAGREGVRNTVGTAVAAGAGLIVPAKVSADYNAIIRDIAIKAGTANTPEEAQLSRTIVSTARDNGLARNDVAAVVNQLVGAGMEVSKALAYAPVASKFVVGQGATGTDTGSMINALQQNARINDPRVMQQALEAIAYQGQAGSFEASDMARWFPELLAGMGKLGIYGMDAVTQLGSMLQVQMKTAGGADEAANNLKNWMEKIGASDTVDAYKKAGIDYQGSMNTGLAKGMSTLEASFALAQRYIQQTDPAKAKALKDAAAKISKETDPAKAKEMMASLEQALRTGDIFADMQVKAALTAYTQNKALYDQLKKDSKEAGGILDKNLAERRQASAQKWREVGQAMDDGLRAVGDALAPFTDRVADGLGKVGRSLGGLADESPRLVTGITAAVGAAIALRGALNVLKVGRGLLNLGRGTLMGNPNVVQRVFVTNGGSAPAAGRGAPGVGAEPSPADPKKPAPAADGATGAKPEAKPARPSLGRRVLDGVVDGAKSSKGNVFLAAAGSVAMAADTAMNADTRDEKAEGYGQAAGTFAGTMAGAAVGAAMGSFIPVIGTAIGGVVGGMLGAWGGGVGGGKAGKALFGSPAQPDAPPAAPWRPMQKLPEYTPAPMLGNPQRFLGVPAAVSPLVKTAAPASPVPVLPGRAAPVTLPRVGAPHAPHAGAQQHRPGPARQAPADPLAVAPPLKLVVPAPVLPGMPAPVVLRGPEVGRPAAAPDLGAVVRSLQVPTPAPVEVKAPPAAKVEPPKPKQVKVDQSFTFAPVVHLVVEGDAKDPRAMVDALMPELRRQFDDYAREQKSRALYDDPHV